MKCPPSSHIFLKCSSLALLAIAYNQFLSQMKTHIFSLYYPPYFSILPSASTGHQPASFASPTERQGIHLSKGYYGHYINELYLLTIKYKVFHIAVKYK